jgi:uncharacterized protein
MSQLDLTGSAPATSHPVRIVDADVHPLPRSFDEIVTRLPTKVRKAGWAERLALMPSIYITPTLTHGLRADSIPEGGGPPGSDPTLLKKQLFDEAKVDLAILLPLVITGMADPDQESALKHAMNDWLAETWLGEYDPGNRFRGSITVDPTRPELAIDEINRWADHEKFVQVMIDQTFPVPLGQIQYHPIYELACQRQLPIALHNNRTPGMRLLTPVGFHSYYAEIHALYPLGFIPHLVSLIVEGVFDKYPSLRVVLVEGGFSWVAPMMWRLDNLWHQSPDQFNSLKHEPSYYLRRHVRVTSQPIEEPDNLRDLHKFMDWFGADQMMLYSSDYPHWDFDDPHEVFARLPRAYRDRILARNSIELYRLPEEVSDTVGE